MVDTSFTYTNMGLFQGNTFWDYTKKSNNMIHTSQSLVSSTKLKLCDLINSDPSLHKGTILLETRIK